MGSERPDCRVSIPIWCDYKELYPPVVVFNKDVSIPIWCDYKSVTGFFQMVTREVSIPIWCDYKSKGFTASKISSQFQFQYGAIIRVLMPIVVAFRFLFQFQYGAIIRHSHR